MLRSIKVPIKVEVYSFITSVLVVLYFFSIVLVGQFSSFLMGGFFYAAIFGTTVFSISSSKSIHGIVLFLLIGTGVIGTLNILFVGNIVPLRLLLIICGLFIATLYIRKETSEVAPLVAFIINVLVVLFHFVKGGVTANVYISSSNNYVSVYLLATLVMYYVICERHETVISVIPSLVTFVICFISGSRGGFLASAILFTGLMVYRYFHGKRNKWAKIILFIILLMVAFMAIIAIIPSVVSRYSDLRVVSRFSSIGFDGSERWEIWKEYVNSIDSLQKLFLGSQLLNLFYMKYYEYNLHNSLLFIHAYFGLPGVIAVLSILAYDLITGIKDRKWVYCLCLIVFVFRGMTDHVFGGHRLTPVFLFILLFPILTKDRRKLKLFN